MSRGALLEEEIRSARDEQPAALDNERAVPLALAAALDVYVGGLLAGGGRIRTLGPPLVRR
jgi:hypothetical protein